MRKEINKKYTILDNRQLTCKTRMMTLSGDISGIKKPGQFVNIAVPGKYLRRPVSISTYNHHSGCLTLLYDVVGSGTEEMSKMKQGTELDVLTALGNGFSDPAPYRKVFLLGGGIGCAPLFQLALDCIDKGVKPILILGFNTREDVILPSEWLNIPEEDIFIATVDGSMGTKGFVTDVIKEKNLKADYFYACGPMPMLRALCLQLDIKGEVSIESRMGCGFGVCMCCSVKTKDGAKRICKDGPVFGKEELIWI